MVIDPSLLLLGKIVLGLVIVYLGVLITPRLLVVGGILITFLLFIGGILLTGAWGVVVFLCDLLRATWVSVKNLYKRVLKEIDECLLIL